jgi:hypothetical protein
MALNTRISVNARNVQLDALRVLLDGGFLRIYDGAQPASPDTAVTTQVLLAELTLANPAFGASVNGVITANAITADSSANATGTAAWFRATKADGTAVIDGSVGTATANLILSSVNIVAGAPVSVSSWTHGLPMQGA